jgi:uncharacterized damage-inducible protein DinB
MVRVEAVLDSWKTIRMDTAQAVEEFPATDFDYKPVEGVMTFGEIATHILQAGDALTGALLDEVDNLAVPEFRAMLGKYIAKLPPHGNPTDLAGALRSTVESRCAELAARPADFYAGMITRFDGQTVTRLEMLQTIKEHELTHRSQMFMYLRLKGLVPATTRRRQTKAKG